MKHQVVICRSNPIAPDPRVEKVARTLSTQGFQVTAVGWDRSGKLPKQQDQEGLHIKRLIIPARYGTGLMNLPALFAWQIGLLWWLFTHHRSFHIIHACDFDTIIPALVCKFLWKKQVIYDIFDFYADHLRRTPEVLKRAVRRIDFWAISKADGVILADDSRTEQIKGSHPKACITIYNSPKDVPASSLSEETIPTKESTLRIAYIGLLQVERGLFEVIDTLRLHPEWHLDLAGFGGDEERIVSEVKNMRNITWHGRISYDHALALSRQSDVLFATYDPVIPNHRYSSPNKVFEAMMLGKPIIVADNTNMDRIINDANCGIVVKYGDKAELERALKRLAQDPGLRISLGDNARHAYDETYSWQKMQVRLINFYAFLIKNRQS